MRASLFRGSLTRAIHLLNLIGMVLLVDGCTEVGRDPFSRARVFERGATEVELVQKAGAPTERLNNPGTWCKEAGGSRELVYKVSARYLGGWVKDAPMFAVAFCIDEASKIIEKATIDW